MNSQSEEITSQSDYKNVSEDEVKSYVRTGFVKYPPNFVDDKDIAGNDLLITEHDIDHPNWLSINLKVREFKETRNSLIALELLMLCDEAGIYPPLSVMKWLSESFGKWHKENGKIPMERALGLVTKGHTGNLMKEGVQKQLEGELMLEIWRLKAMFGLTNIDAIQVVVARLEETDWNQSGLKLRINSGETLLDKYERNWAGHMNDDEIAQEVFEKLNNLSVQEKKQRLRAYPRFSYTHLDKMSAYI